MSGNSDEALMAAMKAYNDNSCSEKAVDKTGLVCAIEAYEAAKIQTPVMGDGAPVGEKPLNDAQIGLSPSSPTNTSDPLIDNAAFDIAIANLGRCDDIMGQYYLDDGELRHFLADYLKRANTSDWQTVRDALEFYAKDESYWEVYPDGVFRTTHIEQDRGKKAREAIAICNAKLGE